jgi:Putative peptidoglycan binding domain
MPDYLHEVTQGECLASIGASYGWNWLSLWNHPANAALKQLRKDPNVLFPGDIVIIPEKRLREESRVTEKRHFFRLLGVPETLRIRLLDEFDRPRANLSYELVIGARRIRGATNADGELKASISPLVTEAQLFVGEERREIALQIGSLDPVEEVSGAQGRLGNLGYDVGPIDGVLGPRTQQALCEFQTHYELETTGNLDSVTIAKLKDHHGH